jgi:hypothetical protein
MVRKNLEQLKSSALELQHILVSSNSYAAKEFLSSNLGALLERVINSESIGLIDDVPKFEIMARGILPVAEQAYFNFYSLARFDEQESVY